MPTLYTTDDNLSLATETDAGFGRRKNRRTMPAVW